MPPTPCTAPQIEEDTDRDRYMSPLEAQAYGLIDHIVGGEEAVFKVGAPHTRCTAELTPCHATVLATMPGLSC